MADAPKPIDDATIAAAKRLKTLTGSTAANVYATILLILALWQGGVFDLVREAARNFRDANERNAMHWKSNADFLAEHGIAWNATLLRFEAKP